MRAFTIATAVVAAVAVLVAIAIKVLFEQEPEYTISNMW